MEESMSDTTTTDSTETPAATTAPEAQPAEQTQGDPADEPLGENGEKALKAERSARAEAEKSAAAYKAKLDQIEQASLSELEKAQKTANESAAQLAEYEKTTMRQKVALEKGVPAKWVDRLRGETEAELTADAEAILADLVPNSSNPKPDLSQGGNGGTNTETTAGQFADAISSAFTR